MLTVVLLKKSTVQQKLHILPRGDKLQRPSEPDYKTPELWFAGILECVVYLSFYAAKNFLPLYALESGISILWVGFFYNARIDSSHVSSV